MFHPLNFESRTHQSSCKHSKFRKHLQPCQQAQWPVVNRPPKTLCLPHNDHARLTIDPHMPLHTFKN